jgi:hypothetical protein
MDTSSVARTATPPYGAPGDPGTLWWNERGAFSTVPTVSGLWSPGSWRGGLEPD